MDKISIVLKKENAPNTDFLCELPLYLKNVSEHYFENGLCLVGKLGNFKVNITENKIKISDASLTKYLFNNNIQMMNRKDIKNAIQKMSDEIHLPIVKADVVSFEYGKNIITKELPASYFRFLGNKPYSDRFEQKNSLYYNQANSQFVSYDKLLESKNRGDVIPELYKACNLLRFEKRYKKNIANYFNCQAITTTMLYDEDFYTKIINDWYAEYCKINKIKLIRINFPMIKTKEQYKLLGVLELIKMQGGELEAITNVNEAFKKGEVTKKQKFDLLQLIRSATKNPNYTTQSDEITELDQKIKESIMYYR